MGLGSISWILGLAVVDPHSNRHNPHATMVGRCLRHNSRQSSLQIFRNLTVFQHQISYHLCIVCQLLLVTQCVSTTDYCTV